MKGGHLIQEGSYNIDINAETVDGKNTFHSLARAVFQSKSVDDLAVCAERIKRGRDRSLSLDKSLVMIQMPSIVLRFPL
jgi:hypothetical protein